MSMRFWICATSRLARFAPPSKIGIEICGANDHAAEPGLNKPPSDGDKVPKLPLSETFGKNAARRGADIGIGPDRVSLRRHKIGRPREQVGRQPGGDFGGRFW